MRTSIFKYSSLAVAITILTFCKKKTNIKIRVFNPYIQENVKDARISIVELHKSNFFTSGWGKIYDNNKEIASGYTDENGEIFFEKEKLRMNSNYDYIIRLTETWGVKNTTFDSHDYKNLNKGKTNDIIVGDYTKGTVNLQFNNLFMPAQSGDSISILPVWYDLFDPRTDQLIKGEGIQNFSLSYDRFNHSLNNYDFTYEDETCGKVFLTIRKRKLGVLTLDTMTIQFYPQRKTLVPVNW
jgi:hypothetical protein